MRKIFTILTIALSALAVSAQDSTPVDKMAQDYNKKCPIVVADGTTLTKVETNESSVIFSHSVSPELFNNLEGIRSILHDSFVAELESSPDSTTQALVSLCKQNKLSIIQRFVNPDGKIFDIIIAPDEL